MQSKYDETRLRALVAESDSMAAVILGLGLRLSGGNYRHIPRIIREYGIDTTHFHGKAANRGERHRGGPARKTAAELLVLGPVGTHVPGKKIKRALLELGAPDVCSMCGILPEWNGKPLSFQVDHINGRRWDNRRDNVRLVCHNCHSQTPNFGSKNKNTPMIDSNEDTLVLPLVATAA